MLLSVIFTSFFLCHVAKVIIGKLAWFDWIIFLVVVYINIYLIRAIVVLYFFYSMIVIGYIIPRLGFDYICIVTGILGRLRFLYLIRIRLGGFIILFAIIIILLFSLFNKHNAPICSFRCLQIDSFIESSIFMTWVIIFHYLFRLLLRLIIATIPFRIRSAFTLASFL